VSATGQPRRRGAGLATDDPIVRRLEKTFASTQVDGLFRRRLRSEVVNRYVAVREGHVLVRPLVNRGMVGRLGRACLYASVALAGTSAGVLAASQSALPGDALYDVKIRIDGLRLEAAPTELRSTVAAYIVDARLNEAMVLVAGGEWARAEHAAAAAGAATKEMAPLLVGDPEAEARIQGHLAVLSGLIETAPPAARAALEHAMAVSDHALDAAVSAPAGTSATNRGGANGGSIDGDSSDGGKGAGGAGAGAGGTGDAGGAGATDGSGGNERADASSRPAASAAPVPNPTPATAVPTPPTSPTSTGDDVADDPDPSTGDRPTPPPSKPPVPNRSAGN
jgi:hypothetical protein